MNLTVADQVSDERMLAAWEAGAGLPPALRPLPLLAASHPATDTDGLASLPLGARDALLFALRERLFGEYLEAVVRCPSCGERLEVRVRTADLHPAADERPVQESGEIALDHANYRLRMRLPNSRDLACAALAQTSEHAADLLFTRCLVHAELEGEPVASDALPPTVRTAAAEAVAEADPNAVARLDLACGACDHVWTAPLDIGAFIWQDLEHRARRLLTDVHALARAYGWSEREILALSARRRLHYIQLAYG